MRAVEPWYDWGLFGWERMDQPGAGDGRFFELEWFGLKVLIVVGKRPPPRPVE